VADTFHARYSALSRTYRYLLLDAPVAPAILHGKVGWFHRALDVGAMHAAAEALLGEHDFSAFRGSQCQARSPVRRVTQAEVTRRGALVVATFRANAFLHHMIRNVVGCLVYVGAGREAPQWVGELLDRRDRTRAAPTFAPDGLYLAAVEYDAALGLPPPAAHPLLELAS
jgi:tRNA pseudouridine38-40 synthase